MRGCMPLLVVLFVTVSTPTVHADAFDHYLNPVLAKAPGADGVLEVKQLTPGELAEHNRVLPNIGSSLVIVKTNDGRFAKLLVQAGRRKTADDPPRQVPILLIERFVTYKEGEERQIQAQGANVTLYGGFHLSLDQGHVVPAALGGDLRFVADDGKVHLEPLGKAKLYLVTKPLPEATPKKTGKLVVGETFETRYFNGSYKLFDDGRRSGTLVLKVDDEGEVTGFFYSDSDGQKYEVAGKVGKPNHLVSFSIKLPRTEILYKGWMFTGNGKAVVGSAILQGRETGFYALRVEDEE